MKVRQLLTTAALAVAALTFSASSLANTQQQDNVFAKATAKFVQTAVKSTINELNQEVMKDVLTASHHFTPEIAQPVLLATVEIKELKNEG